MDSSTSKTVLIIIIFAVLGGLMYYGFSKNEGDGLTTTTGSVSYTGADGSGAIGGDIQGLLYQLNSLKIDSELFKSPAYLSLRDYSNIVPAESIGRKNPFAAFYKIPVVSVKTR